MQGNKTPMLGAIYIRYLIMALFLQIIGIASKGTVIDTAWKAISIIVVIYSSAYASNGEIKKVYLAGIIIYILGQVAAYFAVPSSVFSGLFDLSWLLNVFVISTMGLAVSTKKQKKCKH